jgi:hypothetical protein
VEGLEAIDAKGDIASIACEELFHPWMMLTNGRHCNKADQLLRVLDSDSHCQVLILALYL